MNEKLPTPRADLLLVGSGLATITCFVAGGAAFFFVPISAFLFVLSLLRRFIQPKPGKPFFSPAIWWGSIYLAFGLVVTFIGASSVMTKDITARQIGLVVLVIAIAQIVVPGIIVVVLGYKKSAAHNRTIGVK